MLKKSLISKSRSTKLTNIQESMAGDGKAEIYNPDQYDLEFDNIEDINKKMLHFHSLSSERCLACINNVCVYQIKKTMMNPDWSD